MEYFKSFLQVIGLLEPTKVDFITELPPEVSQLILRKSDWSLRSSVRQHNQERRQQMREEVLGKESPVPVKVKASTKVIGLRRQQQSIPRARFEAAEVFASRRYPKRSPDLSRVSSSSVQRFRKCIRI